MANINYDYIKDYIRSTIAPNDELLQSLEAYAKEYNVPIIQVEAAKMLYVVGKVLRPKKVLEIGTAIGYSAILMTKFLDINGKILTIEKNPDMIELAKGNIKKARLEDKITVLEGDAKEILPSLNEKFDLIFIDAAKGQYLEFFKSCIELLDDNGLLISDNVLFKGMVANDELINKKNKTIVKRMREYLSNICNHKELETSIVPIGDGLALSYKNGGQNE